MKNKKTFDCVDMKWRAQERIYNEIKSMSAAEELVYWKKRERSFRQEISKAKKTTCIGNTLANQPEN